MSSADSSCNTNAWSTPPAHRLHPPQFLHPLKILHLMQRRPMIAGAVQQDVRSLCRFQHDVSSAVNASNSVRPISAMFLILSDLSHLLVRSAGDALIVPVIGL